MQKEKFIVFPLTLGLILVFCSWSLSYPLSIDSPYDFVFNHISPLFWFGLPLILASFYIIATLVKNNYLKLAVCIGVVMSMYSLRYFYYSLPGSDVHAVRGLVEYAIKTSDLDPSKPYHSYFQWPLFFILNEIAISITGLKAIHFEFMLFALLGFLYVTCLYVYASRFSKDANYIAIMAYFIIMYWFLNYQFAPFSLAMGLLYTVFMLETSMLKKRGLTLATMILFTSISFIHPFAGVVFIAYTLAMYITSKNRNYLQLFFFTLTVFLVVSVFFTRFFYPDVVKQLAGIYPYEYSTIIARTFSGRIAMSPPIDAIAQMFSRAIVLSTSVIAGFGFLVLLWKRKLRCIDFAIFISAALYAVAGAVLPVMGRRGFFALLIPISLGANYFSKGKFEKFFKCLFLVLLVLFPFIVLTQSFSDAQIMFQTQNEYQCANFTISYYNWTKQGSILSHFRLMRYLQTKTTSDISFGHDLSSNFPEDAISYDSIVYTVGLGKNFLLHNYPTTVFFGESKYNKVFDSGFSCIVMKAERS